MSCDASPPAGATRTRTVVGLLLLALALQVSAWRTVEGHALADTIEYLQLSSAIVADGGLDPHLRSMRGPLYPLLLSPIPLAFGASPAVSGPAQFFTAQLLQVLLVLGAVLVAVRLGAKFAGSNAALSAGLLVATNPTLLRFGRDPLPETAAGICVALAILQLCGRRTWRRGFASGALGGAAFLLSYKTLPLIAGVGLVLLLFDRWRHRARAAGFALGITALLAFGIALDRLIYGQAGLSLANYLVYNVGFVLASVLVKVGRSDLASDLAQHFARYFGQTIEASPASIAERIENQSSTLWYLLEAPHFLVLPALALAALALVRILRERRGAPGIALLALLLFGFLVSHKHAKSFRLWLPALPMLAALVGLGTDTLMVLAGRMRIGPRILAAFMTILMIAFGWHEFVRSGPREHGNWWRALDWVEEQVADQEQPVVLGATNWPIAYRTSAGMQLSPFPDTLATSDGDLRAGIEAVVAPLDWMLVAVASLRGASVAPTIIAREFELAGAFYEPGNSAAFGPVLALRRSVEGGLRLTSRLDADSSSAAPVAVFTATAPGGQVHEIRIDDLALDAVPGDGLAWLRVDWSIQRELPVSFAIGLRARRDDRELFRTALDLSVPAEFDAFPEGARRDGTLLPIRLNLIESGPYRIALRIYASGPEASAWSFDPPVVVLDHVPD